MREVVLYLSTNDLYSSSFSLHLTSLLTGFLMENNQNLVNDKFKIYSIDISPKVFHVPKYCEKLVVEYLISALQCIHDAYAIGKSLSIGF